MPEEQAQNVGEAVEQIGSLLAGRSDPEPSVVADAPTDAELAVQPGGEESAGAPELTPTGLAKHLGLKPDDLFKQFRIPIDGGDPLTLEEFKELGKELRGVRTAQSELAEAKVAHENGVMLQRQTMQRALAKIPEGSLTQEMVEEIQREHSAHVQTERHTLLQIRPDLQSPQKWDTTRLLLVEHLKPYGFKPIEVDGIIDHRMAKYVIDNAEREKRMRDFDANSKETVTTGKLQAPSKSPARTVRKAETKSAAKVGVPRTNQDKASEVAALLGAK